MAKSLNVNYRSVTEDKDIQIENSFMLTEKRNALKMKSLNGKSSKLKAVRWG